MIIHTVEGVKFPSTPFKGYKICQKAIAVIVTISFQIRQEKIKTQAGVFSILQ